MNATYEKCAKCGQYINKVTTHYVDVQEGDKIIALHYNPCWHWYEGTGELMHEHVAHHRNNYLLYK